MFFIFRGEWSASDLRVRRYALWYTGLLYYSYPLLSYDPASSLPFLTFSLFLLVLLLLVVYNLSSLFDPVDLVAPYFRQAVTPLSHSIQPPSESLIETYFLGHGEELLRPSFLVRFTFLNNLLDFNFLELGLELKLTEHIVSNEPFLI